MKTNRLIRLAASAVVTTAVISCSTIPADAETNYPSSFELTPTGDTVNKLDHYGKQGKWVPAISNKLQNTTYYRNDTIIG
ncbi:MAG: hypothetical protein V4580_16955 [Bacteroidota bacterium]